MTDNDTDQITVTTDEQAFGLVLERANIEIDELRHSALHVYKRSPERGVDNVRVSISLRECS
jgi:hypothetical protein